MPVLFYHSDSFFSVSLVTMMCTLEFNLHLLFPVPFPYRNTCQPDLTQRAQIGLKCHSPQVSK